MSRTEVDGAFVQFGRGAYAAGAEAGEVAAHAGDGLAGAHGAYAVHVVEGSVPGGARLLDLAAFELLLGAGY
ncbi:hypothetical protein ACWGQL_38490 [Streptomyces lydicus]